MDNLRFHRSLAHFFTALAASVAGVVTSIALMLLLRIVLPGHYFTISLGPGAAAWSGYVRAALFFGVILAASGLVAGWLSPARWPGPVLGIGWCGAGILSNTGWGAAWDFFQAVLVATCLLAPPFAHTFAVARTRRRLQKRKEADAQLQQLAQ